MTAARYASIGFVVAVAAVMAWLNLDYARRVFTDVPFVDDWSFIEILRAHARGELGLRHLFMTHQGHPSLPGRLSFLLSYRLQGFDLLTVRWLSILTVLAAAAVAGAATAAIMLRQPRDAGVTQPGFVLGVPLIGQIGNAVVVPLSMAFGVAVLGLGLVGSLRIPAADPAQRRAMLPFLGCIAWGGGALVLIVIGRQEGPMFAQLAPRYTPIVAPIVVGLVGLLGVGASWASLGGRLLTALFVLAVVGLGVTNVEERNMAQYRPDAFARMEAAILNGFAGLDAAGRREAVFSNDLTADKAVAGAAFLREERLGPFRRQ